MTLLTEIVRAVETSVPGNEFKVAKMFSERMTPKDWSENQYVKRNINMLLDNYNNEMSKTRMVYRAGGKITVRGPHPDEAKKIALYNTLTTIAWDNGVDTTEWAYNPNQKRLK